MKRNWKKITVCRSSSCCVNGHTLKATEYDVSMFTIVCCHLRFCSVRQRVHLVNNVLDHVIPFEQDGGLSYAHPWDWGYASNIDSIRTTCD